MNNYERLPPVINNYDRMPSMNYDRIILELMNRISTLEDIVASLLLDKTPQAEEKTPDSLSTGTADSAGRDTTKYLMDGKKYGKNRLVLAIVKNYMEEHPDTSADTLQKVFDKSLQGSLGVVRELDDVKQNYTDYKTRFFTLSDEIIKTTTNDCVVCTQWGISNIGNIIAQANQLGMNITIVK